MTDEYGLNIRQKLFCDILDDPSNGELFGNQTKTYMQVYGETDENAAAANSSRLIRNDKIIAYRNRKLKSISEILEENSHKLIKKAFEMASDGNTAVLNKLLDKIAPSLAENNNTNTEFNADDYINSLSEKYVNKAENTTKLLQTEVKQAKTEQKANK